MQGSLGALFDAASIHSLRMIHGLGGAVVRACQVPKLSHSGFVHMCMYIHMYTVCCASVIKVFTPTSSNSCIPDMTSLQLGR